MGLSPLDFLHTFRFPRQDGVELRHQECFNRVKLGRVDAMSAREIVKDAPCLAVILRPLCSRPRLAHESNVRTGRPYVLATRWSFALRGQSEAGRRIPGYARKPPCYAKRMG